MSICILRMWATQKLAARRTGPTQAAATIRWRCRCRRNASAVMEAGGSDAAGNFYWCFLWESCTPRPHALHGLPARVNAASFHTTWEGQK